MKAPSKECRRLREDIMKNWQTCFKEPHNRMKVEPVKLKSKDEEARPTFCTKPYDTPYHLRKMYEKEIRRSLDAGDRVNGPPWRS